MTISISFTASRNLGALHPIPGVVINVLCRVPHADRYITGACIGGDEFIGVWLFTNRPAARHAVIVPANRSRVSYWWTRIPGGERVEVIEMPPGSSYRDRNLRLVTEATDTYGFPDYPEDHPRSARSGSWQTIRLGRQARKLREWACVQPPYYGLIESAPSWI
jgi:hypothetical protein